MIDDTTSRLTRLLPQVLAATLLVAVFPSLAVWGLHAGGVISSAILSTAVAVLLALGLCYLGGLYWEKRPAARDVLFGDLMIWGWMRRWLIERRLSDAISQLGLAPAQGRRTSIALGVEQRIGLLERLADDLEVRDPYTRGHSRRVARHASLVASRMGLAKAEVAKIRAAAAVHDVGKLATPLEILHKPGRLTDEEFRVIQRHPAEGARMVRLLVEDEDVALMVRHHHERLDGAGYPSRLIGDEIPLGARIIAVADTFDAISSQRPYRSAKQHKVAIDILRAEEGTQLDPDAVHAFCSSYFARRPIGPLVALVNGAERLISGFIGGAAGTTAQVVAVAATTAAVSC